MRHLVRAAIVAALSGSALGGAWEQEEDVGLVIVQAGVGFPEGGSIRLLNEGYSEFGLGGSFTSVLTFDSVVEPADTQTVWHGTLGVRYTHRFESLPDLVFGIEPRIGYQTHESVVSDPVFAGDGWSYGVRIDAGHAFEVWDLQAFANVGAAASTRSEADGEYKLEFVAGVDLSEDWQLSLGYFGTIAPGDLTEQGAYSKHDVGLTILWRFDEAQSLAASIAQTVYADRTARETAVRLALWTSFASEPES